MKKLIMRITLCASLLAPLSYVTSLNAVSPVEAMVSCEVSKIIIAVLNNSTIAHPYDILEVLIKKMNLLVERGCNNQAIADLCTRLKVAISQKQGAPTILSILQGTDPLISHEARERLNKLSKAQCSALLASFTKQILVSPRGDIERVEALFRC